MLNLKNIKKIKNIGNIFSNKKNIMQLPPHLEEIKKNTSFSEKEILDFQKKFLKICKKDQSELGMEQFIRFMRMMGVRSNASLVTRIFHIMDIDQNQAISFSEFMRYFDILLQGDIKQKTEFCFLMIAIGKSGNMDKPIEKKTFGKQELMDLLNQMKESELKNIGEDLTSEDLEELESMCDDLMRMLGVEPHEHVSIQTFRKAIKDDQNVLDVFQLLGNGLQDLMNYQGENKYTRTVRALRLVLDQFNDSLRAVDQVTIRNNLKRLSQKHLKRVNVPHRRRRRVSTVDALFKVIGNRRPSELKSPTKFFRMKVGRKEERALSDAPKKKRLSECVSGTDQQLIKLMSTMPKKSNFSHLKDSIGGNGKRMSGFGAQEKSFTSSSSSSSSSVESRLSKSRVSGDEQRGINSSASSGIDQRELVKKSIFGPGKGKVGGSGGEKIQPFRSKISPIHGNRVQLKLDEKTKNKMNGGERQLEKESKATKGKSKESSKKAIGGDVGPVGDNEAFGGSSVIDMFKDEANIDIAPKDGIDENLLKSNNYAKFKKDSCRNLDDVRQMINEIEEGVYHPKDKEIISSYYNNDRRGLAKKPGFKIFGKRAKKMPTFQKVSRVPNPGSQIFKDFENMLGSHRANMSPKKFEESDKKASPEQQKVFQSPEELIDTILNSEQYSKCKSLSLNCFDSFLSVWLSSPQTL